MDRREIPWRRISSGDNKIQCVTTLVCWNRDVLHRVERVENVEQATPMSVVRVVDVDVEIPRNDDLTLKDGDRFEERGEFVENFFRHLITSGSIDHHLSVNGRCRPI